MIRPNPMGMAFGARHPLGYTPGTRTLGAVSAAQMSAAEAQGLDPTTLLILSNAGATDADIQALMAGTTDVPTLEVKYGIIPPTTETTTVTPSASTTAASATGTGPQVPSGSVLLYTCTITGGVGDLTITPNQAMSLFATALLPHNMTVEQSSNDETILNQLLGTGAPVDFQFTILDSPGNNLLSEAKSVCDGVMLAIVGNNISASNLSIVSSPAIPAAAAAPATPTDAVTWLENNALYIGIGIAGLVVLSAVFGGKRR